MTIEPIVRRRVNLSFRIKAPAKRDEDHAQALEREKVAEIEALEQADIDEKIHRKHCDGGGEDQSRVTPRIARPRRDVHRVLEQNLTRDETADGNENEEAGERCHSFSSRRAAGLATIMSPIRTSAIPSQRRARIASPRKIQELNGTRMWTTLLTGNAIVRGSFRMVASQLNRATIEATMPHQTQPERSPVRPVHDQALVGSAVSARAELDEKFQPRWREERRSTTAPKRWQTSAEEKRSRASSSRRPDETTIEPILEFVRVRELLQNWVVLGRLEEAQSAAEDRIEERLPVCMT